MTAFNGDNAAAVSNAVDVTTGLTYVQSQGIVARLLTLTNLQLMRPGYGIDLSDLVDRRDAPGLVAPEIARRIRQQTGIFGVTVTVEPTRDDESELRVTVSRMAA